MSIPPVPARTPALDESGRFVFPWIQFFQGLVTGESGIASFSSGTHANRPAADVDGTIYVETDRQIAYISISGQWLYYFGVMRTTQDSLPIDLGVNDDRFQVFVTDYAHLLQWDGQAKQWGWGPSENGSGYIVAFVSSPNPATGWQACDGTSGVAVLQSDGTLNFENVPNTAGSFYRQ